MSEEGLSKMGEHKLSPKDLKIETRNAFLVMIGLAVIFIFAIIQLFVITSYDIVLTEAGIKSPLSLDYPSMVVLFTSSWALALIIIQYRKLSKLKSSKP
ncbi:MAG TPA: hypothetical protein VFE98_11415 [Candidatus Bathyarchaeia archaeon]|nr:hypothetical protein [Candidatus Bathyarchaeia archaeon]